MTQKMKWQVIAQLIVLSIFMVWQLPAFSQVKPQIEYTVSVSQPTTSSLVQLFEYVYTTKEFDYAKYLSFAGLRMEEIQNPDDNTHQKRKFTLSRIDNPDTLQMSILKSWLGEN